MSRLQTDLTPRPVFLCGAVAVLAFVFAGMAAGQIGGGSITGSVTDASGGAIGGAKVTATNRGTNDHRETTSNPQGYFEFPLLPAGEYQLAIEKQGFRRSTTEPFALASGTQPRFNIQLEVGAMTQSVEVVGTAPLVNSTTADVGVVMNESKVESLPLNGRNFQQLIGLQPGANASPSNGVSGRGGIVFNGSTALGNNMLLDGVDMSFGESNGVAGASQVNYIVNTISLDAIQEFKSTSSSFGAEYGRATGGVVNVTTRTGTNQFHGDLFEFFRNDKLDANDFFSNRSGLAKSPLRWNQYGGNIGGPIKKDKVFFFFNYEGAQVVQQQQITGNVPTPALLAQVPAAVRQTLVGMYPATFTATSNPSVGLFRGNALSTNDENTYLARGDFYLGAHQLSARFNYNHQDYVLPLLYPSLPRPYPLRFHNALLHDTWTVKPAMVNELRLGFNRSNLNRFEPGRERFPAWITVSDGTINASLPSFIDFTDTTYTLTDNLSVIHGSHSMKAGFEIRVVRSSRGQGGQPTMYYRTLPDLIADNPYQLQLLFGSGRALHDTNYGFYFQDNWRVTQRLQLNLGLRYDYFPPLTGGFNVATRDPYGPFIPNTQTPMFAPDRNNWAPRLGVVYDPTGKQKVVIRAGAGITYLPPQPYFFFNMAFIDPRLALTAIVTPQDLGGISVKYPFPQSVTDAIIANPSLLPSNLILSRLVADYNARDTYAEQWNFSVQTSLTPSAALQVSYVGNHTLKIPEPVPLNLTDATLGRRPVAGLGEVDWVENAGNTMYHSLQVSFDQRLWHGLAYDVYYTFGKSLGYLAPDNTQSPQTNNAIQDPNNLRGSVGPIQADIRHQFTFIHSYQLPTPKFARSGIGRAFVGGWNLQGIMNWRSGIPVNVLSGLDLVGNGHPGGDRPDLVGGVDPYKRNSSALTWLNPAAFDNNAPRLQKRFGNLGFDALYGPSGFSYDAAIHKTFNITERHRITFRCEAFNVLNHKILGNPSSTLTAPNFGQILTLANSPRAFQLALKYQF